MVAGTGVHQECVRLGKCQHLGCDCVEFCVFCDRREKRLLLALELNSEAHYSVCILDAVSYRVSDPDAHVLDSYRHHGLRSVDGDVSAELL